MEKRDLYDLNKKLTGETIFKGEKYPSDRKILVVAIWIENSNGELLIQKRSIEKDGKWATTGGHPKSGETSLQGIITEVKEELGLDISHEDIKFIYSDFDDKVFLDMYYVKMDVDTNKLVIQKEEVSEVIWASIDEIKNIINSGEFKNSHTEMFKNYLEFKKLSI